MEWTHPGTCGKREAVSLRRSPGRDFHEHCDGWAGQLDIAKQVFQVHAADFEGRAVLRKRLGRDQVAEFFANLPPAWSVSKRVAGSHYWDRVLRRAGHTVRLIAPQFVKPYVKSNKNDGYDANVRGTVAKAPLFPMYVGAENVHFGMQDLSLLHGNPRLFVPVGGGKYSSAFGRCQITNNTANWLRCTDWTRSGQDDCGADLLGRIGATAAAAGGNFQQAISRMAPQWSSMPGGQQPQLTMDQARQLFDKAIGYLPECNK